MFGEPNSNDLELDAIYLGVLTAKRVKPLSRLEYPITACIMDAIKGMGLIVEPVVRLVKSGARVEHWIMGKEHSLIDQHRSDFDGIPLEENLAQAVKLEARYFGYPICCAKAYIEVPYTPNDLTPQDQKLLFHYACPGCEKTPRLIPLYQLAFDEAEILYKRLWKGIGIKNTP